jgi:folate-binding protein YgfZ
MTLEAAVRAAARTLADYDGAAAAVDFGDVAAEYRALAEGAAIVWMPQRRIVRAEGSERMAFLHGQLSSDVKGLEPGRGQPSLLLNAQGRVEGVLALYDAGEAIEIVCDASRLESTRERLERFLIADDVELETEVVPGACLGLAGPRAREVMTAVCGRSFSLGHEWARAEVELCGMHARVLARGEMRVPLYEMFVDADAGTSSAIDGLWRSLRDAGASPVGTAAYEILRVESGVARYGVDVDSGRIALEARLEWAIHFAKGCYVGQEVVERAVSRGRLNRRLSLLGVDVPVPVGACVDGGGERDLVTSSVVSPVHGPLAFAYLDLEHGDPGQSVAVAGTPARVLAWPRAETYAGLRR